MARTEIAISRTSVNFLRFSSCIEGKNRKLMEIGDKGGWEINGVRR